MIEVSDAIRGEQCTECGNTITDDDPAAIFITGYSYGSQRFELVLCDVCAQELIGAISDELERQYDGDRIDND